MTKPTFTVCALFYGDFPEIAARCLHSLREHLTTSQVQFRLGLNEVGARSKAIINKFVADDPRPVRQWISSVNEHKYPVMRQMLHQSPPTTSHVMWFDDDSYIKPVPPQHSWLDQVSLAATKADMLGSIWRMKYQGGQREWIKHQPWYNGKPPETVVTFISGGWWCIKAEILQRHNWPIPELDHRGGDVMLGELCRQHAYELRSFTHQLGINADLNGNSAKSPRRGFDSKPIGFDFVPPTESPPPKPKPKFFNPGL